MHFKEDQFSTQLSLKSRQPGFSVSIKETFLLCRNPLISFSRAIALATLAVSSKNMRRVNLYF